MGFLVFYCGSKYLIALAFKEQIFVKRNVSNFSIRNWIDYFTCFCRSVAKIFFAGTGTSDDQYWLFVV